MDPICPLLTLGSDRHAVCDGFDTDHRCGVDDGPDPLDRSQQLRFCLRPTYVDCPHFTRHAVAMTSPRIEGVPTPSLDVLLAPTRLVIDADGARIGLRSRGALPSYGRPLVAALVILAATTGVVATGTVQRLAALIGSAGNPSDDASGFVAPSMTPSPTPAATASPRPSAIPTALRTATPSPTPTAAPTSQAPQPQTYVVQPGDTLQAIADRYGTTVAAIQQANGIADQNLITAGQVLTIP